MNSGCDDQFKNNKISGHNKSDAYLYFVFLNKLNQRVVMHSIGILCHPHCYY